MTDNELPELTNEELLDHVSEFQFFPNGFGLDSEEHASAYIEDYYFHALLVHRRQDGWYAIHNSLKRSWNGEDFVPAPVNSSEFEDFMSKTRFSRSEAIRLARMLVNEHRISGRTFREFLAWLNTVKKNKQSWQNTVEEEVPHSGEVQKIEDNLQDRYDVEAEDLQNKQ